MFAPLLLCCLPLTGAAGDAPDPAAIAEPADDWWLNAGPVAPTGLPRGEASRESFAAFVRSDGAGRDGRGVALALLIAATADPDEPGAAGQAELARGALLGRHVGSLEARFAARTATAEELSAALLSPPFDRNPSARAGDRYDALLNAAALAHRVGPSDELAKEEELAAAILVAAAKKPWFGWMAERGGRWFAHAPDGPRPVVDSRKTEGTAPSGDADGPDAAATWDRQWRARAVTLALNTLLVKTAEDAAARAAATAFLARGPLGERLETLSGLPDCAPARRFEAALLQELPPDAADGPDAVRVRVLSHLEAGEFAAAAPLVAGLIETHGETARRLHWRARCAAAAGDWPAAAAAWERLAAEYPDDPHAPPAAELAAAAIDAPAAIERTAAVVAAEADRVFVSPPDRATFEVLLGDFWGGTNDSAALRVAGFADWPNRTLRLTAWPAAGGEPVAGLDLNPDRTRVLLGDGRSSRCPVRRRSRRSTSKRSRGPTAGGGGCGSGSGRRPTGPASRRRRGRGSGKCCRSQRTAGLFDRATWPPARSRSPGTCRTAGSKIGTLTPAARTPEADASCPAVRRGRAADVGGRFDGTDFELTLTYGPAAAIAAPAVEWPDREERTVADLGGLWAALMPRYMAFLAESAAE